MRMNLPESRSYCFPRVEQPTLISLSSAHLLEMLECIRYFQLECLTFVHHFVYSDFMSLVRLIK